MPKPESTASVDEVRRYAGHNYSAMTCGVTKNYIGDMAEDVYTKRSNNGGINHGREPKFAVDNDT